MPSDPVPSGWSQLAFILELRKDIESGGPPPLSYYLARYPEHEEEVQREYEAILGSRDPAADAGFDALASVTRTDGAVVRGVGRLSPSDRERWIATMAKVDSDLSALVARSMGHSTEPAVEGTWVGHYRLVRLLGRGGMGQVWEARDTTLERDVALKLLNSSSPTERSRLFFEREARAAARLRHPGIVAVFEAGEADGRHYIAMELVDGGRTFATELDEAGERPKGYYLHTATLFAEVCDALESAHQAGVIHRDLKPQNILVDPSGRARVTDFGLAKIVDEQSLSHIGEGAGTYSYMSPEQVTLKHIGLDHRTDVFSLGAVLYEALTAIRPFQGDTAQQIAQNILFEEPPEPRTIASRVPDELAVICAKSLEKRPKDRFDSMADLAAELRRYLAHEPILTRPPGKARRALRWMQRHPVASSTGSVGLFALGVVSVLLTFLWFAYGDLDLRRVEAEESSYVSNIHVAEVGGVRTLDALEACPVYLRNWEWGHLYLRANPSLATLTGHTDSISNVAYSPDGKLIASASWDHTVRLWDAESGAHIRTLEGHDGAVIDAQFSADSRYLVSASSDTTLRIWDVWTGAFELRTAHTAPVTALAVAPEGPHFASGDGDGNLFVWSFANRESLSLIGHEARIQAAQFDATGRMLVTGGHDRTVLVWNVEESAPRRRFQDDSKEITAVSFDPGGARVVCGSWSGELRVLDLEEGGSEVVKAHGFPASVARFSPDGSRILSASWDPRRGIPWWDRWSGLLPRPLFGKQAPQLTLWDASLESPLALAEQAGYVTAAAFRPDGQVVASVALDRVVRVFDVDTGALTGELRGHRAEVTSIAFRPDGTRIVTGDSNGGLLLWDAATQEPARVLDGHELHVDRVEFSPDGSRAFSTSFDGSVQVWDGVTGKAGPGTQISGIPPLNFTASARGTDVAFSSGDKVYVWAKDTPEPMVFEGHGTSLHQLAFGWGDRLLVSADLDQHILLWDVESRTIARRLRGTTAAFTPDGSLLAIWREDGAIELYDAERLEPVGTLQEDAPAGVLLAFTADGKRLVAAGADNTVRLWDVEEERKIATLPHADLVRGLAFAEDGTRLVTVAHNEFVAHLWDGETGDRIAELSGHSGEVIGARFGAGGERVLSWSHDATLRLWHAQDGEGLLTLSGHSAPITYAGFSLDGKRILSGASDGKLRLWHSDLQQARSMWNSR